MRSILIMLTAAAIVGAPQVNSQAKRLQANSAESSAIEGRVLNAATGEPLNKVDLILRRVDVSPNAHSPASYTIFTDNSGRFGLLDIEPGRYRLLATHSGFVSAEYGSRGPAQPGATLSVDGGRSLQDIVFRLSPHGVLSGRVRGTNGEPIPNLELQAMRYGYVQGRKQLSSFGHAVTNDLGEYRIVGLAQGSYYLRASYSTPVWFGQTAVEDYVPTYYPGTADATFAAPIDVTAGSEFRAADLTLANARTVRIRGQVVNAGSDRGMVTVMLAPADRSGVRGVNRTYVTNPQGDFDIHGVTPGTYTFVALMFEGGAYTSAKTVLDATNDMDGVRIAIAPGLELRGNVLVEGDAIPNLTDVRISLLPFAGGPILTPMPNTQVQQDGTFTLSNVNPDRYNLTAFELPDGYYVKSIRLNDEEAMDSGLNLSQSSGPINIVLAPGAGQTEGVVVNERYETVPGATVVLIPQDGQRHNQRQFYGVTTTDQYGRFSLKNLYPGSYKVFAWEDLEYDAFMDPDFVKPVEDKGQALSMQENGSMRIQLKLQTQGTRLR